MASMSTNTDDWLDNKKIHMCAIDLVYRSSKTISGLGWSSYHSLQSYAPFFDHDHGVCSFETYFKSMFPSTPFLVHCSLVSWQVSSHRPFQWFVSTRSCAWSAWQRCWNGCMTRPCLQGLRRMLLAGIKSDAKTLEQVPVVSKVRTTYLFCLAAAMRVTLSCCWNSSCRCWLPQKSDLNIEE